MYDEKRIWQVFQSYVFINALSTSGLCSKKVMLPVCFSWGFASHQLFVSGFRLLRGRSSVFFPCGVNCFDIEGMQVCITSCWVRTETDLLHERQNIQNLFGVVCIMGFIYNTMKQCIRGGWSGRCQKFCSAANPMEYPWYHSVHLSCVEGPCFWVESPTKYVKNWLCETKLLLSRTKWIYPFWVHMFIITAL